MAPPPPAKDQPTSSQAHRRCYETHRRRRSRPSKGTVGCAYGAGRRGQRPCEPNQLFRCFLSRIRRNLSAVRSNADLDRLLGDLNYDLAGVDVDENAPPRFPYIRALLDGGSAAIRSELGGVVRDGVVDAYLQDVLPAMGAEHCLERGAYVFIARAGVYDELCRETAEYRSYDVRQMRDTIFRGRRSMLLLPACDRTAGWRWRLLIVVPEARTLWIADPHAKAATVPAAFLHNLNRMLLGRDESIPVVEARNVHPVTCITVHEGSNNSAIATMLHAEVLFCTGSDLRMVDGQPDLAGLVLQTCDRDDTELLVRSYRRKLLSLFVDLGKINKTRGSWSETVQSRIKRRTHLCHVLGRWRDADTRLDAEAETDDDGDDDDHTDNDYDDVSDDDTDVYNNEDEGSDRDDDE